MRAVRSCSTEPRPDADKAKARLAAEKGWLELGEQVGVAVHIFRLGGIYGPGRRFVMRCLLPLTF